MGIASGRTYPPEPQLPRVVALGNFRGGPPPSAAEIRVTEFLFGAPPPPPLTIANPLALAAGPASVFICDPTLSAVFRWDSAHDEVVEAPFKPPVDVPFALDLGPDGSLYLADRSGVRRADPGGGTLQTYALPAGEPFRPGGVLLVGNQLWVTNLAVHRIEIFDAQTAAHLRSFGEHGLGPGQFILPRSMARTPDGNVCVVDVLNARVQILGPECQYLGQIGGQGDVVGRFGRPKDVAVGPDGTIFVSDAFSQRVHVFAPDGTPLLAFGEPGSGIGSLTMPAGIAISAAAPRTGLALPADATPQYYLWVGEQLQDPGVRVYAWVKPSTSRRRTAGGGAAGRRAPHAPCLALPQSPLETGRLQRLPQTHER